MTNDFETPDANDGGAQVLALAEAQLAALGPAFNPEDMKALYVIVDGYPDIGGDGAGEVVASLARLLAAAITGQRFGRDAVAVHIHAWRYVATARPDGQARAALMTGLTAMTDLYAGKAAEAA